jgi:hypothetical protein
MRLLLRRDRAGRSVIAILAAYALIIESLLVGMVGATVAARAASGTAPPGHELCLRQADDTAPVPSDIPVDHSSCTAHCLACVAGGHAFALVLRTVSLDQLSIAADAVQWAAPDGPVSWPVRNLNARPRGPPLAT